LHVIGLDGRVPSLATLRDGSWPMTRPLSFVVRPDRLAAVQPVLDYARSAAGRARIEAAGYLASGALAGATPR
jgi:hypothetical protein